MTVNINSITKTYSEITSKGSKEQEFIEGVLEYSYTIYFNGGATHDGKYFTKATSISDVKDLIKKFNS